MFVRKLIQKFIADTILNQITKLRGKVAENRQQASDIPTEQLREILPKKKPAQEVKTK